MPSREEVIAAAQGRAREVRAELAGLVDWMDAHPDDAPDPVQDAIARTVGALYATEIGEAPTVRSALTRAVDGLGALRERLGEVPTNVRPEARWIDQLARDLDHPKEELERAMAQPDLTVRVDAHSESNFFTGFGGTIDEGGLFVATWEVLPEGTKVHLGIQLPGVGPIHTRGVVTWTREATGPEGQPGMGLALPDLDDHGRQAITTFMQRHEPIFHEV